MKRQLQKTTLAAILCVLTAGCAVTTDPMVKEDILKRIASDRESMYKDQEPLTTAITMEEAMARAIKYNLDHRLKLMEEALALRQTDLVTYDMLPRLVAAAGYTERDSFNASSSVNVDTGVPNFTNSTSQDKGHYLGDLTLTWNILDFGVTYFQAKQQADRAHIMNERRRKVIHSIMQQIRQAYWLALGAQQLEGRCEPLLKQVRKALEDASSIESEKLRPPMETLTYRKSLLEILKQLEAFRDELAQAKPRLASLINLPPGQTLILVSPSKLEMLDVTEKIEKLEDQALLLRPELIEADYNERISRNETYKAIARMLPGMEMTVGGHYDSNSFLVNQKWVEGGARVTWNLLNLLSGPTQIKIAKSQTEIAQAQRLALSMAILTQVHVAYQDFFNRKRQYELSEQLQDVDARIYEQTVNQAKSGSTNQLNEIRSATSALMAEFRSYQNYASLQNACGQITATLGQDPLPETVTSHEIKPLAEAIAARLKPPVDYCVPVSATAAKPASQPEQPAAAPTLELESITKGNGTILSWSSSNATACEIEPGIGKVDPRGEISVAPGTTTKYTLTCQGPDNRPVSRSATVTVPVAAAVPVTVIPAVAVVPAVATLPPGNADARLCKQTILALEFDNARSTIKPQHFAELKKLADFLKEFPEATGEISGHTDNRPLGMKNIDNQILSQRRADTIRSYLINTFGIDPKRIVAKGYGAKKPIADNDTAEGRQKNRRIETNFSCGK
ncbi:TolC family protein [Geobacter sp. SVR]|uniref:TolC family protein n=1 Tax=Geobacter sp. SVR TaxID=2495594 RepID=UPI00143F00DC|nr:TolC family protein [Geobacter sp. SVR]BCS52866.1 hypothetical protein GSVR_11740 [Geobacter sp. SVR]GCF86734.1 hypothetical protein GSbR_33340 [Geobacter sp. SVR]